MHSKLSRVLNLLDFGNINILNESGQLARKISPREHVEALFTYLDLAGYLSPELLEKAVTYLYAARPFACPSDIAIKDLKQTVEIAHREGSFNIAWFLDNFCKEDYFQVDDIIDLIAFLQQTAFDRKFGVERDRLQAKPWLEESKATFQALAATLGITSPLPPAHASYCGTGIMGAASPRVATRIQYFNTLKTHCGDLWALSGNRELSEGLDKEPVMSEVALAVGKPVNFVKKGAGAAERTFLDGVTETMMVNYLLQTLCPGKPIALVDSAVEEGHWRATTAQGAKDIARILIQKIQTEQMELEKDGNYRFMIIAEQPYAGRMARQVQRAFNAEIQSKGLSLRVSVEGVGPGIPQKELDDIGVLNRVNSELGSLMAERFNDARLQLQQDKSLALRDPKILLFSERDATYKKMQETSASMEALRLA